MSPCEEEIFGLLTVALARNLDIDIKIIQRLTKEAEEHKDERVRFWGGARLRMTFVAIENIRKGVRHRALITNWFLPVVKHLRVWNPYYRRRWRKTPPLKQFEAFARTHGIRLSNS
jgi:hypothetical protein